MDLKDMVIIGAGPAGISAALYAKRAGVVPYVFHTKTSKIQDATLVQNFYGFPDGIVGEELYQRGLKQAQNLGINILLSEVLQIKWEKAYFIIKYIENNAEVEIKAKTVILATGNENLLPKIKDFQKYNGKGVCYCAVCDGFFFRNKEIGVLGNGRFALNELKTLLGNTEKISIFTNGESSDGIEKLLKENKIENIPIYTEKIESLEGDTSLEKIILENGKQVNVSGLFVALGQASSIDFAKTLGIVLENNSIMVDDKMQTNIPGIYASGDCTGGLNQVEKAVYQGAVAGLGAAKYVKNIGTNF